MSKLKSLSELQVLIQNSVQNKSMLAELNQIIIEKPPISIPERIKIYQNAYHIRLLESLRDDYSRVEDKLGELEFEKLASVFIEKTPSRVRNLAEYSKSFSDFIKTQKPSVYHEAIMDWLEILSVNAEIPGQQLNSEDIQSGKEFKITILPSTIAERIGNYSIVVSSIDGEVKFLDLDEVHFNFLKFLEVERSLQEIGQYAQSYKIGDEILSKIISDWIQNKIIYCKAIE